MQDHEKKEIYAADIIYGTNNEFGFDYLRDNLKYSSDSMVQRGKHFAIIDEVDSILIDEARTPLIISSSTEENIGYYKKINRIVKQLSSDDYVIDEKAKNTILTDTGNDRVEELLAAANMIEHGTALYDPQNIDITRYIAQALKAHTVFKNDVDYIIKDGKIVLIDQFTGRMSEGRRYSEGLHQALEAKENLKIAPENHTIASITFQNYFRMYKKIAGMTGTAMTEAKEFRDIYGLSIAQIPQNISVKRKDENDIIYKTAKGKYNALIREVQSAHNKKQPILIGTASIEKSEHISKLLKKVKIKHTVLNAKHHQKEAKIIAQAGRSSSVTIATNMAGRGTDIMLGGNPSVLSGKNSKYDVQTDRQNVIDAGGLLVIGTERHESRRIDDQLRGRSGRQGDPGRTIFYLSMEDDLMRLFGSDKLTNFLTKLGLKDDDAIDHPWISKALKRAQSKVEMTNFEIRKDVVKFDDIVNEQRKVIYEQRDHIIKNPNSIYTAMNQITDEVNENIIHHTLSHKHKESWDIDSLSKEVMDLYGTPLELIKDYCASEGVGRNDVRKKLSSIAHDIVEKRLKQCNDNLDLFCNILRQIYLKNLDGLWREHMHSLDQLRTGISLRSYAQKDPLIEYKMESFKMFEELILSSHVRTIKHLSHINIQSADQDNSVMKQPNTSQLSRNDKCWCGSGKRFKHCHGAYDRSQENEQ